jgi:hypothetical protein
MEKVLVFLVVVLWALYFNASNLRTMEIKYFMKDISGFHFYLDIFFTTGFSIYFLIQIFGYIF